MLIIPVYSIFINNNGYYMKKLIINESQKERLFEAYSEGFSFKKLEMIGQNSDGDEQLKYCEKYLGPMQNQGSSRCTFTLSDNMILKLAHGMREAGIEQNKVEFKLYEDSDTPLLPRIFKHDDGFTYLVCESVIPATTTDFEQFLGVPFYGVYSHNSPRRRKLSGRGDVEVGFDKYFNDDFEDGDIAEISINDIMSYIEFGGKNVPQEYRENFENIIRSSWWLSEIQHLSRKYGLTDLTIVDNFGMVNRDGNPLIVILDSGFNMDVFRKYYL